MSKQKQKTKKTKQLRTKKQKRNQKNKSSVAKCTLSTSIYCTPKFRQATIIIYIFFIPVLLLLFIVSVFVRPPHISTNKPPTFSHKIHINQNIHFHYLRQIKYYPNKLEKNKKDKRKKQLRKQKKKYNVAILRMYFTHQMYLFAISDEILHQAFF